MPRAATPVDHVEQAGIFIRGKVVRRTKRHVGDDNKEVVTYGVMLNGTIADVADWQPTTYIDIREEVMIPVMVRVFMSRGGAPCWGLVRDDGPRGAF